MPDHSSLERKRLRDRRAQQNLRDKKVRYTAKLEEQVAHCAEYHNDKGVQRLLETIRGLRTENDAHRARWVALSSLVNSWDRVLEESPGGPTSNPWTSQPSWSGGSYTPPIQRPTAAREIPPHLNTSPAGRLPEVDLPWNRRPLYSDDFSDPRTVSCQWFRSLEQIIECPDSPSSPLDILYGSKTNPLANDIHLMLEKRPMRDPEKLAIGWVIYHFSRWIISPSPATYERLPCFLRPVQDQLQIVHPLAFCCVPWPKIRSNLIRKWHMFDCNRDALFGMLSCCAKVRWPWGEKFLERSDDNQLCMRKTFYETFMKEEGWGVTADFIREYPDLMDGVDISSVIFRMT